VCVKKEYKTPGGSVSQKYFSSLHRSPSKHTLLYTMVSVASAEYNFLSSTDLMTSVHASFSFKKEPSYPLMMNQKYKESVSTQSISSLI